MKVDMNEIIGTLSLIFGESNIKKISDELVLYRQDGLIGYYDILNDIQAEPKFNRCVVECGAILGDVNIKSNCKLCFSDITMDTFNSATLHILGSNYNCDFDYPCCMVKVPKSNNLFMIKSKDKIDIFHRNKSGAIESIDSSISDNDIFIYGDPKFIVIQYIKANGEVVGITEDGEVGDIETLLRAKYPNLTVEKRGKIKTYTINTPDGIYHLNRLGNLY